MAEPQTNTTTQDEGGSAPGRRRRFWSLLGQVAQAGMAAMFAAFLTWAGVAIFAVDWLEAPEQHATTSSYKVVDVNRVSWRTYCGRHEGECILERLDVTVEEPVPGGGVKNTVVKMDVIDDKTTVGSRVLLHRAPSGQLTEDYPVEYGGKPQAAAVIGGVAALVGAAVLVSTRRQDAHPGRHSGR